MEPKSIENRSKNGPAGREPRCTKEDSFRAESDAEAIEVLKQWYQSKGPAFFEHVRLKNMGMNWRDVVIAEAYVDFTIGEATLVTYPLAIYPRIELKAA